MTSWTAPTPNEELALLREASSIAIVGASANASRASYFVATYLLAETKYELYFVNPNLTEILSKPCYPTLADLPAVPDVVDVFRKPEDLDEVADEAIAIGTKVLWLQLGLYNEALANRVQDAGIAVVMDRCLKIEHARFKGGLHLAGFDTGVISSRRHSDLR
jgi:uncharacterized protein